MIQEGRRAAGGPAAAGIVGNYGHHNTGDEAILESLVRQVREVWPECDIVILSDDVPDTQRRMPSCRVIPLFLPGRGQLSRLVRTPIHWWRTLRSVGLLVVGGGGLFVDSYRRSAWLFAALIGLARLAGARVTCYQLGVGPVATPMGRRLFRLGANLAHAISVRDAESAQVLRRLGVRRKVAIQADPALLLEPSAAVGPLFPAHDRRLRVGVAAVPYCAPGLWYESDEARFRDYVAALAALADAVVEQNGVPVFLRFSRGDDIAAQAVHLQMRHPAAAVVLSEERDPRELLALVGQMDLIVGARLHSVVFATTARVPCLAIAYQEKVSSYLHSLGQGGRVLDVRTLSGARLVEQFEALARDRVQVRAELDQAVPLLQDLARQGAAVLREAWARAER